MAERPDSATAQLKLRVRETLRQALEDAAAANDWPLNREIQNRLEASLEADAAFGGQRNADFFRSVAARIALVERLTGKSWLDDYATWTAAKQMIQYVADDFAPLPPNFSAIYDAVVKHREAAAEASRLWRAYKEKWPSGKRPPNALLALAPSDALASQLIEDVRLRPDGTERTDEEMAEMKADFDAVVEAQRHAEAMGEEVAKAEEEEAKAKASGMDIARQIIELTNRARKAD